MSRAILGIDIGIRNMSFCELTVAEDRTLTVGRWEVIDLLDGDNGNDILWGGTAVFGRASFMLSDVTLFIVPPDFAARLKHCLPYFPV